MGSVASGPHRFDFLLTVTKPPTATGDLFQSEVLEQQAQYGALKATQEAGQMTRNLMRVRQGGAAPLLGSRQLALSISA
jgi:hypothetical protein